MVLFESVLWMPNQSFLHGDILSTELPLAWDSHMGQCHSIEKETLSNSKKILHHKPSLCKLTPATTKKARTYLTLNIIFGVHDTRLNSSFNNLLFHHTQYRSSSHDSTQTQKWVLFFIKHLLKLMPIIKWIPVHDWWILQQFLYECFCFFWQFLQLEAYLKITIQILLCLMALFFSPIQF